MNGLPVGWKRRLDGRLRSAQSRCRGGAIQRRTRLPHRRRRDLPPERIAVIPNGISTTVFDRISEPAALDQDLLLFVGQLQEFKGLDYLLDALPAVRDSLSAASNCGSFIRPARCSTGTGHRRHGWV